MIGANLEKALEKNVYLETKLENVDIEKCWIDTTIIFL